MKDSEAFYEKLKSQLEETSTFPSAYLFKFILPAVNNDNILALENIFKNQEAIITKRDSKTGKYTSISVKVTMQSATEIIEKYKLAGKIKGIISL